MVEFVFYLPFHPELQSFNGEALGQGVNLIDNDEHLVLARVDQVVDFFDLAALKVRDIDHVDYYASAVYLFEDGLDNLGAVERSDVIGEPRYLSRLWWTTLLLPLVLEKLVLILQLVASVADEVIVRPLFSISFLLQ